MAKLFQLFTLAAAFAALFTGVNGGWDPRSSNMIAGYWGQNSMGTADGQQRLIHYCPSDKIDVILLSFLPSLRNMHSLNFANQEVGPLEHDIQDCQNNHKKSILLSIGGETTSDIGWGTRDEAVKAARDLWAAYGPPIDPDIHRPLGNAIVEGIDIDYEKNIENLLPFAEELRRLTDESSAKDGKKYLVTLAPQCPFPDENLKALLQSDVAWDGVLIQFYNNERCGVISFVPGGEQQERFNLEEWQRWAENSANPNVKILIGAPADSQAGAGYVPGHVLADVIQYSKRFKNFGGLMFWEISRLWANHDLLDKARFALGGAEIGIPELPKEKPSWTDKKKGKAPDHPKEEETSDGKSVVPGATLPTIPIIRSSASISCGPAFLGLVAGCSLVSTLVSSAAFASASPSSDSSLETTPVSSPLATNAVPPVVTAGRENPPPSSTLTTSAVVSTSTTQTSNEVERPTTTKAAKPGRPTKLCVSRPPSSDKDAVPWTWNVPSSGLVRQWNQCGGQDWNGGNTCEKPYICKYFSDWYSQCE